MDWSKGYSSIIYMTIVDPISWRDIDRIEILGGTITHSYSDLREAADIDVANYEETAEQLIRVWLDVSQAGDASHTPLFTGYATSPGRSISGNLVSNRLQCYSVLKPAQDILLPRGWYAPTGTNGAALVKDLLRCTKTKIDIEGTDEPLKEAILAEEGEHNLSMANAILSSMKWRLQIRGDGSILISPKPKITDISTTFDSISNDILEQSISISHDWYNCPNVLRVVYGGLSVVVRDDSPTSKYSTVSRGREIWREESNAFLKEDESLSTYANRRMKELQKVATTINYTRRFQPDLYVRDNIRINYPSMDVKDIYEITSQTISLSENAKVSEEVQEVLPDE